MATTLEMLLAQLAAQQGGGPGLPNPAPSMPIPLKTIAPPLAGPPREILEPPEAPLDTRIINQYTALGGERPTPPAPPSRLQRIANAMMGFGAGYEGRGGEFLQQLREPQRRYEARLDDYNQRQASLRLRGIEVAQDDADRRTRRAQQLADREFQVEHDRESRRLNLQDDELKARLQQSFEIEKEARRQRYEEVRELEREQRRREDDARQIAGRLGTGPGAAPPHIAKELGEFYANVRQTVSPAAAKWVNAQARRAEILARPATGGGAAVSRREAQDLQRRTSQAAAGIAQMERLARQAMESPENKRAPILGQMRAMTQTIAVQFPELTETGEHNGWPYARLRLRGSGGAGQQQRQQQPQQAPVDPLKLGVQ